jgi:6-pyruvoyltetrahydropterin 2'-reductase
MQEDGLKFSEYFISTQGEGPFCGRLSFFLRLHGCNLDCAFCDSGFSKTKENKITKPVDEVAYFIQNKLMNMYKFKTFNIVITGGEPLLQYKDIHSLINKLRVFFGSSVELSFEIETNGTIQLDQQYFNDLITTPNLYFNISPKLCNSGNTENNYNESLFNNLLDLYYVNSNLFFSKIRYKFVIDASSEEKILEQINELSDFLMSKFSFHIFENLFDIYLMPMGTHSNEIIEGYSNIQDVLVNNNLSHNYNISPRLQSIVWGGRRGK